MNSTVSFQAGRFTLARYCSRDVVAAVATVAPLPSSPVGRLLGVLSWGNGGGYVASAEFDIGTGVQVVVGGSEVSLDVSVDESPAIQDAPFQVGGGLALIPWGEVGETLLNKQPPVIRSRYIDGLEPGDARRLWIPPFARAAHWSGDPGARVEFLDRGNEVVAAGCPIKQQGQELVSWQASYLYPLDAQIVLVTNTSERRLFGRLAFIIGLWGKSNVDL